METEFLKPFEDGVRELVATMLQSSYCVATATDASPCADVSGVVGLSGEIPVQVVLSFPRPTAVKMVAQLLAMDESEVDDGILGDGVGEMANIVAGMAKSRLSCESRHLQLSLPSVVVSSDHDLSLFHANGVAHLQLDTDYGRFSLRVCPTPGS